MPATSLRPARRLAAVAVLLTVLAAWAPAATASPEGEMNGVGPRVAESGLGVITTTPTRPYEDVKLKK